jgi:hypothetical protein
MVQDDTAQSTASNGPTTVYDMMAGYDMELKSVSAEKTAQL